MSAIFRTTVIVIKIVSSDTELIFVAHYLRNMILITVLLGFLLADVAPVGVQCF